MQAFELQLHHVPSGQVRRAHGSRHVLTVSWRWQSQSRDRRFRGSVFAACSMICHLTLCPISRNSRDVSSRRPVCCVRDSDSSPCIASHVLQRDSSHCCGSARRGARVDGSANVRGSRPEVRAPCPARSLPGSANDDHGQYNGGGGAAHAGCNECSLPMNESTCNSPVGSP